MREHVQLVVPSNRLLHLVVTHSRIAFIYSFIRCERFLGPDPFDPFDQHLLTAALAFLFFFL